MTILVVCTDDRADVIKDLLVGTPLYRITGTPSDPDCMQWRPQKNKWRRLRKTPFPDQFDLAFVHAGDSSLVSGSLEQSSTVIVRFSSTGYAAASRTNRRAFQRFAAEDDRYRGAPLVLSVLLPFGMAPPWPLTLKDMEMLVAIARKNGPHLPLCCDLPDAPVDVLSPLMALDIQIQGYLAVHSPLDPWRRVREKWPVVASQTGPVLCLDPDTGGRTVGLPLFTPAADHYFRQHLPVDIQHDPSVFELYQSCLFSHRSETCRRRLVQDLLAENDTFEPGGAMRLCWELASNQGAAFSIELETLSCVQTCRLFAAAHREFCQTICHMLT